MKRLETDLLFWIGHGVNRHGISVQGADADADTASSLEGLMIAYNQKLKDMSPRKRFEMRVKRIGDEFRQSFSRNGGFGAHLDIKDKVLCLKRAYHSETGSAMEDKLDAILGFVLYMMATINATPPLTTQWKLWFANEALALPTLFQDDSWDLRLQAHCVNLLGQEPHLQGHRMVYVDSIVESLAPVNADVKREMDALGDIIMSKFPTHPATRQWSEDHEQLMVAFQRVYEAPVQNITERYGHTPQISLNELVTRNWR